MASDNLGRDIYWAARDRGYSTKQAATLAGFSGQPQYKADWEQDFGGPLPEWLREYGLDPTPSVSPYEEVFEGFAKASDIVFGVWSKINKMAMDEEQRKLYELQAKKNLAGMAGEGAVPGFGGINMWTLAAFVGAGALALFLLKKT